MKKDSIFEKVDFNINTEVLNQNIKNYLSKRKDRNIFPAIGVFVSFLIGFFTMDFKPVLFLTKDNMKLLYIILLGITLFWVLFEIYKALYGTKTEDFCMQLAKDTYENEERTAIFIISTQIDGTTKVLVYKEASWDCFFLPFLSYDYMKSIHDQLDELKLKISNKVGFDVDDFEISYLNCDMNSIKMNYSKNKSNLIKYKFFQINFKSNDILRLLRGKREFHFHNIQYFWKSKQELLNDGNTYIKNQDIITHVFDVISHEGLCDSTFIPKQNKPKEIKIIWNISSKCFYNCPICATGKMKDKQVSFEDKRNILLALVPMKNNIKQIDFSGGDPLVDQEDREIIKYASYIFSKDRITISTTGKTLHNVQSEITTFCDNFEFTYDYPRFENDVERETNYNFDNYEQAVKLKKLGCKVHINIPIQEKNTDPKVINKIVKDLKELSPDSITLLRLMPVGNLDYSRYPKTYEPSEFIKMFENEMNDQEYIKEFKLHCALRLKSKDKLEYNMCNLLTEKIGINVNGDVYACAWACNLGIEGDKNPFYLGSLLENDLDKILDSKNSQLILSRTENRSFCRVFSIASTSYSEKGFHEDNDSLVL